MAVERLLLIGPSNVGDGILISGAITRLRSAYPDAHLTVAVGERAHALYDGDPRIQTLMNLDLFEGAAGKLRLFGALWRFQPQVVVDLRHTVLPFLLKPFTAFRYFRRPPESIQHMAERHVWYLKAQAPGIPDATPLGPALVFSARDHTQAEQLWRRWQVSPEDRLIMICPGARSHIKRWTPEGFAAVADRLVEKLGVRIVFSGEPDEKEIIEDVLKQMSHPAHISVGLTTIRQVGVLMQRMEAVLTNDSASLHLASALGIPTVAIFGPTDEQKYGPWGIGTTVRRRLFCAPCEQPQCRYNHECMRFVRPDEVYAALCDLLAKTPRREEKGARLR